MCTHGTGPDRTPGPKLPKEPQWEDPALDLDQWRHEFLKSLGIHKPGASEPPGAGTAALTVREEREEDEKLQETDPKRHEMGNGEVGFHAPGPVSSSTYTEAHGAIVLTLMDTMQMSHNGVASASQDNDGSRQTLTQRRAR